MKKITITIAIILTLAVNAFASDEKIKPEVLAAFNSRFAGAEDITWVEGEEFYKVTFTFHGAKMSAFYSTKAELIGVTRNILSTQLPLYLQNSLRRDYPGYWILDLFEVSKKQGFSYYITIRNAGTRYILKSGYGDDWEVYQKHDLEN